ncbi:MAG: amino acid transporter permease [Frondihabitans sp.]|nr:amino acid transporter permease [Frondihabitans sp.]
MALASLVALARFSPRRGLGYGVATVYVELFRNIPSLVVLYLAYFGLPEFGIRIGNYAIGIGVLVIVIGAYLGESLRGSLQSIPAGQWEAPLSLGLTRIQTLRHVILPQMYRRAWPSLTNHLMIVLFGTPLLSVIDVRELTSAAAEINSETFRPVEVYVYAIVIYLVIGVLFQFAMSRLGKILFTAPASGR